MRTKGQKSRGTLMMDWQHLISNKRLGQESMHTQRKDDRTEFQRDYDRLIFSSPFRRLQNKTQVFPLPGRIFVHNRLTHSIEVASVGRSLGSEVSKNIIRRNPELIDSHVSECGAIVSAACLAHDMGNPPFGHSGEKAIATYFSERSGIGLKDQLSPEEWCDITHFEGNANAFRLLTHQFVGRRPGGFVMTYSTLASIVKYPFESTAAGSKQKFGFFQSEKEDYLKIAKELQLIQLNKPGEPLRFARHPLVYLVEAADDICYEVMDIEDAHKLKIISTDETKRLLMAFFDETRQKEIFKVFDYVTDANEQIVYLRSGVIGCLVHECVQAFLANEESIMNGTFQGCLINHISPRPLAAYRDCEAFSYAKIYRSKDVVDIELAGFKVISTLIELMIEAVTHPEKAYSQLLINRVSSQYDINATTLYGKVMAVLDYISGMTDVYALDLYHKINGNSLPIV